MIQVLVLADDLTGAIEIGAQFSKRGLGATVSTSHSIASRPQGGSVLVVDTESRHAPPVEAGWRVMLLASSARERGVPLIYKKTDSTLRGNIASEMSAILSAFPGEPLVYVPAYPKLRRTCRGGRLYLSGQPLEQTSFARDPLNPIWTGSVPELLKREIPAPIVQIANAAALDRALEAGSGQAVYVCDAETDADVEAIARVLVEKNRLRLTAGTGALADFISEMLAIPSAPEADPPSLRTSLCVCGSLHLASLKQVSHAESIGYSSIGFAPEVLFEPDLLERQAGHNLIRIATEHYSKHRHLIIKTAPSLHDIPPYFQQAHRKGMNNHEAATFVSRQIGLITRAIIEAARVDLLLVFGGDTALGILEAFEETSIRPVREILPGIPLSEIRLEDRKMALVSKAGGFGPVDTIPLILDSLIEKES